MGTLGFGPATPLEDASEDVDNHDCQCIDPDDQYLMEVECGSVSFVHAACGKQPGPWADEAFGMEPVPVTLHWHASTDYWTGEVDAYGDVTINGLTAPKENSR